MQEALANHRAPSADHYGLVIIASGPGGGAVICVETTMADGSTMTFAGDIVVLAAGSICSIELLLRSANDSHPAGLANSSA